MNRTPELDPHAVWQAAAVGCMLGAIFSIYNTLVFSSLQGTQIIVARLLLLCCSLLLLAYLMTERQRPLVHRCLAVYLLLALLVVYFLWSLDTAMTAAEMAWEPFLRHRLVMIVFAALAPGEFLATATIILTLTGEACLEYWVGGVRFGPGLRTGEPWTTVACALPILLVVYYRARHSAQERAWRLEQQEFLTVGRLAHMALAVRDLTNTPLQTLQVGLELLRQGTPGPVVLPPMQRAAAHIAELNQLLRGYENDFPWNTGDEAFDPRTVLKRD